MDEWTPTPEELDVIMVFALGNTIEYNGKPQLGSIMGRLGNQFDLKSVGRYLPRYVNSAMADAITMYEEEGREDSIEYLGQLGHLSEWKLRREFEKWKVRRKNESRF